MRPPVKQPFVKLAVPLVLASRSPRRVELLASVGIEVMGRPCDVDEDPLPGEAPLAYVERITRCKLLAAERAAESGLSGRHALLVADTTVTIDGAILGKPADEHEAKSMLERLAGRTHEVLTCYGLALVSGAAAAPVGAVRTVCTRVTMRSASSSEIDAYVASGEPFGKAGAYAIQGLGALFVERIDGSYSAVVGLPVCEVVQDLARLGIAELRTAEPRA
jgi:septum formation protein